MPATTIAADKKLTAREAAAMIGVEPCTLEKWRVTRRADLPYIRVSERLIRYRLSDVEKFLERRIVHPVN